MSNGTLDVFCGSDFWDYNLSWNTTDPDLTKCFERTVLVWFPCAFLWTFSILEIYYIANSKKRDIPWNWLNLSKLVVTVALCVLSAVDLVTSIKNAKNENGSMPKVDIYTPVIKIISFLLSAVLLVFNKKHGLQTSGLQFLFWLLLALCGAVQFRTEIRQAQVQVPEPYYDYVSYMIYYPLVLAMLLLNCLADKSPKHTQYAKLEKPCPEEGASFLSKLFFSWFDSLAWLGFKKPLEAEDLWDMNPQDSAKEVVQLFEKHWNMTLQKCESSFSQHTRASFTQNSASVDFVNSNKKKQASIVPALIASFGPTFLFGAVLNVIQDLMTFVSPMILGLLITFVKEKQEDWKGYTYAVLLLATATVQTIIMSQYFNRMFIVGMRIRTALIATIYKKALKISNATRKGTTVGEIVNLMAVDAQKFVELTIYLNTIWSAPIQISLSLYFLWYELGPSIFAGLVTMISMIPLNGYIANKMKVLQIKQMKNKDHRVKLMNEILSGIKVLKLYAWEPSFEKQVLEIRSKEIKVLKELAYMNAGTSFIWSCAPFLVSLVTFATYVLVDERNVLDANKAYVSISLFNILRYPLSMLPMTITQMVQSWVSVKRINKFLNSEELNPNNVTHDQKEVDTIVFGNGNFSWGDEPVLKNINIRLPKGSLSAVVGTVGCGKSSLIAAALGEMEKISGRVNVVGSIAYVSQQAWIQNATLRDNILFGKKFDKKIYDKVVKACALKPDFDMLPAGDQTEIGEKGINLSGGQKQRVSLARAVYADSDIYLLDDPLSAVDSHVGKHIFDQVIGPKGLLGKKTRVLVTHGITYLSQTDKILVMKNGEISESGTYQELLDKKGSFAEFLLQHMSEDPTEDLDEIESLVPDEIKTEFKRMRSQVSESEGSEKANGSPKRQKSVDSSGKEIQPLISNEDLKSGSKKEGERLIEVEKSEIGSVSWEVYKYYLKSVGFFLAVATIILNVVFQGFGIGSNMWLGRWADDEDLVNGTQNTQRRDMYLGVYAALGFGKAIASVLVVFVPNYATSIIAAKKLHAFLLSGVMRLPMTFFDTTPSGRILSRFSKDVDVLDSILPPNIFYSLYLLFEVIGTLVVISYTTPLFVIVILPIGVVYYFIQRFYVATSRQLKRLESVSRSPIYSHFGEMITGAQAIRAFEQEQRFIDESERKVDQNQVCYYPSIISDRWLAVRLEMIGNLIIFFAALFAVLGKDTLPGLVGLSVTYALQITHTLNWLVRMSSEVETNIVAVERIKEYGEATQEAPWEVPSKNPPSLWPEVGAVEFKNYAFRYRPGLDLVLKGVNFSVNGGEKIGIVGRTGAGKSSLTLALFRIIEAAQGEIYIDGVKISELGLHTLRSRLTIIPQDPVLFSGSLRINLDPFEKYSDDEVWRSLEHAHLKNFVKGLPSGLQHEVTEGGENLSVGQRQLICLARALLRKTKVLILDEATAAVDLETDDLIQRTIRTEFKSCTILTIAHRLNTIMDSDRVLVLDKGQIVEFDSPATLLLNSKSIFYSMCKDAGLA